MFNITNVILGAGGRVEQDYLREHMKEQTPSPLIPSTNPLHLFRVYHLFHRLPRYRSIAVRLNFLLVTCSLLCMSTALHAPTPTREQSQGNWNPRMCISHPCSLQTKFVSCFAVLQLASMFVCLIKLICSIYLWV